ncbi:MAG TPA: ABC transporter ATP-binding protein [Treponema sp.]|nr:ABC transporter ATP-binding protein [Treponema sp.]
MNSCFSAENLYRVWDSVTIDFSFTAEKGTMTVIVGRSGSGKSSVLRLIAGLEQFSVRSDGRTPVITLNGRDITHLAPGKRGIGMVFQNHALFNHLSVADNVAYGLRCTGVHAAEARKSAEEYLSLFGLAGFGARRPGTLSGGEAQRVSLARTLIMQPSLVLFDEPLSALDAPLRKKLAADIRGSQKREGFTGIFVTHDIAEAKAVADRIILMKAGKMQWQGGPEDFSEDMID